MEENFEDNRPTLAVFDLDGVARDNSTRLQRYMDMEAYRRGDFHAYRSSIAGYTEADCMEDPPIPWGCVLTAMIAKAFNADRKVILTANEEKSRKKTLQWIRHYLWVDFEDCDLLMRPDPILGDDGLYDISREPFFTSAEYKRESLERLADEYNIIVMVDDHPDVVEVAKNMGIYTIQPHAPTVCAIPTGDSKTMVWKSEDLR